MHIQCTGAILMALLVGAASPVALASASGFIQRNFWKYSSGGGTVHRVTNDSRFPYFPDDVSFPMLFEDTQRNDSWPTNEQFGVQFIGFLAPPVSGNYNFYIAADDNAALWLSTDETPASKVLIAREPAWNGPREYITGSNFGTRGNPPQNRSTTFFPSGIPLVAGRCYYIECIFSEGGGGNNMSVAWQVPGGPAPTNGSTPIEGRYLSAPVDPPVIASGPANATVSVGQSATFTINVTGTPHLHVTWFRDGTTVVAQGNGRSSYTTPLNRPSDNGGTFHAVITNRNGAVTSRTAMLTVNPDSIAPSMVSAASFNGKTIGLCYSEIMDAATISNRNNYSINGTSPTGVVVRADNKTVILDMALPATSPFSIVVNGGTDFAGNPLPANSMVSGTIWAAARDVIGPATNNGATLPAPGGTNFTWNAGDVDVIAGGRDIWDTADEFHFIYQERTGDFDVKVKVQRLDPSRRWAKAGLMARVTLDGNSPTIQAYTTAPSATTAEAETGLRSPSYMSILGWESFRPQLPRSNAWVRLQRAHPHTAPVR